MIGASCLRCPWTFELPGDTWRHRTELYGASVLHAAGHGIKEDAGDFPFRLFVRVERQRIPA